MPRGEHPWIISQSNFNSKERTGSNGCLRMLADREGVADSIICKGVKLIVNNSCKAGRQKLERPRGLIGGGFCLGLTWEFL